jgi:tetratricopeptide (TPR) repeat protein
MKMVGVALVALVVGLALGWTLKPAPEAAEAPFVAAAPVAAAPAAAPAAQQAPPKGSASCEETLGQIQAALAEAQQGKSEAAGLAEHLDELLMKAGGAGRDGVPQPWPEKMPERYTKEGFTAAVEEIKKACPKEFPAGTRANCDEFPCTLQLVHLGEGHDWNGMKTCARFKELFGERMSWSSMGGKARDGSAIAYSSVWPMPEDQDVREFMGEYEGNLSKRRRVRMEAFQSEARRAEFEGPCQDGSDAWACQEAAEAYKLSDHEKYKELMARGCELGDGRSCNNMAWSRCHEQRLCDDEALSSAERAAELNPEDGKGALDTLAYVLCKTGRRAEADASYERSCKAGYAENCGKKCQ